MNKQHELDISTIDELSNEYGAIFIKTTNAVKDINTLYSIEDIKNLKERMTAFLDDIDDLQHMFFYKLKDEFFIATDVEFEVTYGKEAQEIVLIDKRVEITKTDLVTGDEIEGAELQVVDENGKICQY